MLRHVIATTTHFTQVPNEIIRHPRLSSEAVRLLLWLLSQPDTGELCLSEAARRAGIKPTAFQRAKSQLCQEGYAHEWRRQGPGGRWVTTQLIANTPLTGDEAAAIRDGDRPPPPSGRKPVVGRPRGRAVGGQPPNTEGKTDTHPPTRPQPDPQPAPQSAPPPTPRDFLPEELVERGALILASVSSREPRLPLTGREVEQLAPLAADWLLRGAGARQLREQLTTGLPEPVHHPAALVGDRLRRKLPQAPPVELGWRAMVPGQRGAESWDGSAARRGAAAVRAAMRGGA
ncbi:hypothetical protein ACIHFE_17780 [Streptomyces sp. NPDC052396]|uniref:hypothetical protein n=1 Tax=Streptomyces sp. NPDC052396 TaxID=3365689 RepID=UPI0037D76DBA